MAVITDVLDPTGDVDEGIESNDVIGTESESETDEIINVIVPETDEVEPEPLEKTEDVDPIGDECECYCYGFFVKAPRTAFTQNPKYSDAYLKSKGLFREVDNGVE